jgi:ABC-2 type transport system permease protein
MNWNRVFAIYLRHLYFLRRSYDRISDTFYWITLDLVIWGITAIYFQRFSPDIQSVVFMIISGVLLWNITWRSQIEISLGTIEELWNKNLVNLFVAPLRFSEWITGLVIMGITKGILSFLFGTAVAFFFYHIGIFRYSYHLPVFFILLLMSGWFIGFFIASIILRYGTRVQTLAWSFTWLLSPFSAIYYPIDTLPQWAQTISKFVPMSYVFEQGRNLLYNGVVDYGQLLICFGLNVFYLLLSLFLFQSSFKSVLQKGLVKVY